MGTSFSLLVGWLALGSPAVAQGAPAPVVVAPEGLISGSVSEIWVALDTSDHPEQSGPPRVYADTTIRFLGPQRPGVWRYGLMVPDDADEVAVHVGAFGQRYDISLNVWLPSESSLEFPRLIDGQTGVAEIMFDVVGPNLPPADALQVVLGEGRVVSVERVGDALQVRVAPSDDPFPRNIIVGVRDRRGRTQPVWGALRLRARPALPLLSEPGSQVEISVSDRLYGPYQADENGLINAWVDQYPGEILASALFEDDLGNTTQTEIPLASQSAAQLVGLITDDRRPGQRAPALFLYGLQSSGNPWKSDAPVCQTPALDLSTRELSGGNWMVSLPALLDGQLQDLRVDCSIGGGAANTQVRVPMAQGVPARLGLRVWPTELRSDYPFAEVRVVVEDYGGDRLPVDNVKVWAERGALEVHRRTGNALQADYDGTDVGEADVVHAAWVVEPHDGWTHQIFLAWPDVAGAGRVTVEAQAVDALGRPVEGQKLLLDAGRTAEEVYTDDTGWASAQVLALEEGPIPISARTRELSVAGVLIRGEGEKPKTDFELQASSLVSMTPGRVAGISVAVEPSLLRAAPGAVAYVTVALEDRGGNPITDEEVSVMVSEGEIGPLRVRSDGTWVAEYHPAPGDRPREVQVTAETESVRSTTLLAVQPRVVRVSVGPWAGVHGNLGAPLSSVLGLDVDFRLRSRLAGEGLMLRLGASTYRLKGQAATGLGGAATLDARMVPITGASLYRGDWGRLGIWGGVGGLLAVQDLSVGFGGDTVSRGTRVLAGATGIGGAGWRMLGGELTLQLQSSWIPTGGGEVSFAGNIGGLATGLGFRVVF